MGCSGCGWAEMGFESFEAKQHQELSGETMVGGPSFRDGLGAAAVVWEDRVVESRCLRRLVLVLEGVVWELNCVMLVLRVVVVVVAAAAMKY